jgi:hypothetical protein
MAKKKGSGSANAKDAAKGTSGKDMAQADDKKENKNKDIAGEAAAHEEPLDRHEDAIRKGNHSSEQPTVFAASEHAAPAEPLVPAAEPEELGEKMTQLMAEAKDAAKSTMNKVNEVKEAAKSTMKKMNEAKAMLPSDPSAAVEAVGHTVVPTLILRPLNRFYGLAVAPPEWPPPPLTFRLMFLRAVPLVLACGFLLVIVIGSVVMLLLLSPLLICLGALATPLALIAGAAYLRRNPTTVATSTPIEPPMSRSEWMTSPSAYFGGGSGGLSYASAQQRRRSEAISVTDSVNPSASAAFNEHVCEATSLAVYGCGILAAAHVGALAALEKHGLRPEKLTTLAGVSAGAVVVAMFAVGSDAKSIYQLVQQLPFERLGIPELSAVIRASTNMLVTVLNKLGRRDAVSTRRLAAASSGNGPGLNSGEVLEQMVGDALKAQCGDRDITLGGVQRRFGKRLVIVVAELDTGSERRLTPETDASLPLRIAGT